MGSLVYRGERIFDRSVDATGAYLLVEIGPAQEVEDSFVQTTERDFEATGSELIDEQAEGFFARSVDLVDAAGDEDQVLHPGPGAQGLVQAIDQVIDVGEEQGTLQAQHQHVFALAQAVSLGADEGAVGVTREEG